jgi:glucose/arabinose dehydrogenase
LRRAFIVLAGVLVLCIGIGGFLVIRPVWRPGRGGPSRTGSTVSFPTENPFGGQWTAIELFPGVEFDNPVGIVQAKTDAATFFVVEQKGRLLSIKPGSSAKANVALDLSANVVSRGEAGLVGVALHPTFGRTSAPSGKYVYLFYVAREGERMFDRLSRFEVAADGLALEPKSEFVLINQLDRDTDHNSGNLQFGPDGFLYVGVGDEGGIADQFGNAQHIDRNLFSGILRIDVDCRPGRSHPIRHQPQTGKTQGYCIPDDNPFVNAAPGALEEFWSIGLRNPWRFSFDSTGLWGGDVGQNLRETVFLATKGSNHRWSYREGTNAFADSPLHGQRPEPQIGVETAPVYDYPHINGNGCVIGGYVYRGIQFPELDGKYIFGDYNSGLVWALEAQALTGVLGVPKLETLMRLPPDRRIASFGVDRNGELLICAYGKRSTVLSVRRRQE